MDQADNIMKTCQVLKFQDFPDDFQEPLGNLLFNIGEYFRQTGKYIEAERMYRQTLELDKRVLGDDHPDTLATLKSIHFGLLSLQTGSGRQCSCI
jgi:tetratricopeptide (TPR) repeat protein